jgi:hypothetical protein
MAVSPTLDGGLTPAPPGFEGNAPGLPQVDLPQVAAAPAPEPEPLANVTAPPVIEVGVPPDQATPGTATPDAATAPPVAPAPAAAPAAAPAPEPAQAAPVGAPGDSFGPPEGETQVAGGLMELIQRLSRVTPDSMPRPRAQDFLDVTPSGAPALRAASQQEVDDVWKILGTNQTGPFNGISMRGQYMPQDTQAFVDAIRQANPDLFAAAGRGVQTREQMVAAAEAIGFDGAARMLLARKPGETFNIEELLAAGAAVRVATDELRRSAQAAMAGMRSPEAPELLRQMQFNLAFTSVLANQADGAMTESGRALGGARFMRDVLSVIPTDSAEVVRRLGASGSPTDARSMIEAMGGEQLLRTQAAMWAQVPPGAAAARFARASLGRRTVDALIEAYINSLLALPTTHIVNMLGNTAYGLWSIPERFLAGAIGTGRTFLRIGGDEQVYMGEAFAQMAGMYQSLGDAFRVAGQTWRTGVPADAISKMDVLRYDAISAENLQLGGTMAQGIELLGTIVGNPQSMASAAQATQRGVDRAVNAAGNLVRVPGRALLTEDAFFKTVGHNGELWAQAYRQMQLLMQDGMSKADAALEVARMRQHPPEMWERSATDAARAMTFQQELGPYMQQLAAVMQHPLAKAFVPFFTTPVNVYRAALHRTPMSVFLSPQVRSDILAGGARADMAMSRIALGSVAMYWIYGQVADSMANPDFRITGGRPADRALGQSWDRQGIQPYSFCDRVDGQWKCHSYARVDPLSALVGMAADMAQHVAANPTGEGLDDQIMGMALAGVVGLYDYTLQQPMAQGISDIAQLLTERQAGVGESRAERAAGLLAERLASVAFMPLTGGVVMRAIERSMSPATSNTMAETPEVANSNPVRRGFDRALQQTRAGIPGESDEVAPRLNIWGEVVQPTEGGALPLFWPFRMTSGRADALEDRLMALGGVLTLPGDKFPNTNVRLTASQYNWIIQRMNDDGSGGQTFREQLVDLVQDSSFTNMDPKQQADTIRLIRRTRWEAATRDALDNFPDLDRRVTRDREFRAVTGRSPPPEQEP